MQPFNPTKTLKENSPYQARALQIILTGNGRLQSKPKQGKFHIIGIIGGELEYTAIHQLELIPFWEDSRCKTPQFWAQIRVRLPRFILQRIKAEVQTN